MGDLDRPTFGASLTRTSSTEWQVPPPPLRFPLRDALFALQAPDNPLSYRSAAAHTSTETFRGPLKVHSTEKSRALKEVGRARRKGESFGRGFAEERPLSTPRPPADIDRPKTVPKSLPSNASRSKLAQLKAAQDAGTSSWPVLEESASMPDLSSSSSVRRNVKTAASVSVFDEIRPTWTSAARAVLGHTRRMASSHQRGGEGEGEDGDDALPLAALTMDSSWCGMSMQSNRALPRPVKDWAAKGLEFTDGGLGIGERFSELKQLARRSPGPVYEQQSFGSVSKWRSQASQPTKQIESRHHSAQAYRMGERREQHRKHERQPGPGYYELKGFTEELLHKIAKRSKSKQALAE